MSSGFFLVTLLLVLPWRPASAAVTPKWAAKEMIRSQRIVEMAPGQTTTFTIGFKNVGRETWLADGEKFVSVYTYSPKYRASQFYDTTWPSERQPARMVEDVVKPGAIGRFTITLFAPLKAGRYSETFVLAAEDTAWLTGGTFTMDIKVDQKLATAGVFAPGFKAAKLLVSAREMSLDAGETKDFRVAFKNIGKTAWKKDGKTKLVLRASRDTNTIAFRHTSWPDTEVAAVMPSDEIKPGQMIFLDFSLTAPNMGGRFTPKFVLTTDDGGIVDGGGIEIPVEVRQGLVPAQVSPYLSSEFAGAGPRGPNIRVGLFRTTDPVVFAADGPYSLYDSNEQLIRQMSGLTAVRFDFSSYTYEVTNNGWTWTSPKHVRLSPLNPATTIFEIQSLENRPTWDTSINFNRYRGDLEVLYAPATAKLWVIEELPVEDYIRGMAETSNGSPYEYQKALVTAARTYALYVKSIGGKHQSEFHDLNTTGNDQVYKGYVSELVRPNVVRAAEETRGQVVAYNGEMVVTPYFSNSDGRTRAWTEVWSRSPHPWLVSVPAPYDQGKTLWGHGVGMSANDAVGRANAGSQWQDILKHYYTGVEIRQLY